MSGVARPGHQATYPRKSPDSPIRADNLRHCKTPVRPADAGRQQVTNIRLKQAIFQRKNLRFRILFGYYFHLYIIHLYNIFHTFFRSFPYLQGGLTYFGLRKRRKFRVCSTSPGRKVLKGFIRFVRMKPHSHFCLTDFAEWGFCPNAYFSKFGQTSTQT